jgi:hypothetical protein
MEMAVVVVVVVVMVVGDKQGRFTLITFGLVRLVFLCA